MATSWSSKLRDWGGLLPSELLSDDVTMQREGKGCVGIRLVAQFAMPDDGPIILETFASLARHGYAMSVRCWRCERRVEINLAAFPEDMAYVGRHFQCRCGERCRPTIRKAGWASGATGAARLPACADATSTS